jgi:hypothetical protein
LGADIAASATSYLHYSGGIYNDADCGTTATHTATIVGYGEDYWIIKESFGTAWGENGFMRLQIVDNETGGLCAMFKYPFVYPTLIGVENPSSTVPDAPTNLMRVYALTDMTQATFSWTAPASDGGSAIIQYEVIYTSSEANSGELRYYTFDTYFTITIAGPYKVNVKVLANNSVGNSAASPAIDIWVGSVPEMPVISKTNLRNGMVLIELAAPESNLFPAETYNFYVETATGWNEAVYYTTSSDLDVYVSVTVLEPYNSSVTNTVTLKMTAKNYFGESHFSAV